MPRRILQRLEWTRVKESEADEARAERERERLAMMLIDWHDFAVVRTIEFDAADNVMEWGRPLSKPQVMHLNKTGQMPGVCAICMLLRHELPLYMQCMLT